MPEIKKNKRITLGSFDFIKGFGIIIVVLAHSINAYDQSSVFFKPIQTLLTLGIYILPMFMLASGYGFKLGSTKAILKRTFFDLLVPYLIIAAVYTLVCPFTYFPMHHSFKRSFGIGLRYLAAFILGIKEPGRTFLGVAVEWNTAAWFFLALFIAHNLLNLIVRLKSLPLQLLSIAGCIVAAQLLSNADMYLFCLIDALWAVPLCYLGYMLKTRNLLSALMSNRWTYVILVPIFLLDMLIPEYLPFRLHSGLLCAFPNMAYDCAISLLVMLVGLWVGKLQWRILDPIKHVGMYSYWILAIHAAEMLALPWYLMHTPGALAAPIVFCIEIALKTILIAVLCGCLKSISKLLYQRRIAHRAQATTR